jgi:hypothetical protein
VVGHHSLPVDDNRLSLMEQQEVSMLRVRECCSLAIVLSAFFPVTGCAPGPPHPGPAIRDVLENLFPIALIGIGFSY